MCVIYREQNGILHRPVKTCRTGRIIFRFQHPLQYRLQKGTVCPGGRNRADLFMIVANQYAGAVIITVDQRMQRNKTTQQIVEPGAADKLLTQTH